MDFKISLVITQDITVTPALSIRSGELEFSGAYYSGS